MTLSILIPTKGRDSLEKTTTSVVAQLDEGDQMLQDLNDNAPWGHRARQRLMEKASGDHLLFIDDDDVYLPGALDAVRLAVSASPGRVHLFRMRYSDGRFCWTSPGDLSEGNVSTQIVVVPNEPDKLGSWESDEYTQDFEFIRQTVAKFGQPPLWWTQVIVEAGLADDVVRP